MEISALPLIFQLFRWRGIILLLAPAIIRAQIEDLGNQIQGVEVECDPSEIRLKLKTTKPYFGRIYPKALQKSVCEKTYEGESQLNGSYITSYSLPLTSCNTVLKEIPTGMEYINHGVVIQMHRSLITQNDRVYSLRCRYETMNTTITAWLNMTLHSSRSDSDSIPAMQLEGTAALPTVMMTIYKGSSESRQMADLVTIGDPIALVINLAQQSAYGMLVRDCFVKDGVDMGGVQPLIDSRGCPVDPTLFGNLVYSADLTQAYVIFRAHKFPYTNSLYYECTVKFCLKIGGDCKRLPSPPDCGKAQSRYRRDSLRHERSANTTAGKVVAVVRGISVREPDQIMSGQTDTAFQNDFDKVSKSHWCVPRSAFAIILAVTAFLIVIAVTVLVSVILEKRKRRTSQKGDASDLYSSSYNSYMSQFEEDRTRNMQ